MRMGDVCRLGDWEDYLLEGKGMSAGMKAIVLGLVCILVISLLGNYAMMRRVQLASHGGGEDAPVKVPEVLEASDIHVLNGGQAETSPAKQEETVRSEGQEAAQPEVPPLLIEQSRFYLSNNLMIRLNEQATPDMASRLEITPEIVIDNVDTYGRYLDIYGKFTPGTLYTIMVTNAAGQKAVAVETAPNKESALRFGTNGRLFPLSNDYWNLPVSGMNVKGKMRVKVYEAYPSAVLDFLKDADTESSRLISETEVPVKGELNQEVSICLDLASIGIAKKPGLYLLELADTGKEWNLYSRTVIVTNLGVLATFANEDAIVAVRSLADNSPVAGAAVQLYTRKLQLVCEGKTDEHGFCRLPVMQLGDKEDYIEYLMAAKDDDRVFVSISGVPGGISTDRAAIDCERGICRPGESMHVFAALRGKDLTAKGEVPVEFVLWDPKGNKMASSVLTGNKLGIYEWCVKIPESAPTGEYFVAMETPGDYGNGYMGGTEFLVGEYIPDQVKLDFSMACNVADNTAVLRGKAEYYFGLPLRNNPVMFNVKAKKVAFTPKGFEDYMFCYAPVIGNELYMANNDISTDENGDFQANLVMDKPGEGFDAPVEYSVEASCISAIGGRTVTAFQSEKVYFSEYYVGLRQAEAADGLCRVDVIGVTPDGKRVPLENRSFKYELDSVDWNYVLKKTDERYERVWEEVVKPVKKGALDMKAGGISFGKEIGAGHFRFTVFDDKDAGLAQMDFWHWFGESGVRVKDPGVLFFEYDKSAYNPGDVATVTFDSLADGVGMMMAGFCKMAEPVEFAVKKGRNTVAIPIPLDLKYGRWFATVAVASRENTASDPMIQKGNVELPVVQESHRLNVAVTVPAEARPCSDVEISVNVIDSTGAPASGNVILWGVDCGILSLTNYKMPNWFEVFHGEAGLPLYFTNGYLGLYPVINAGTEKIGGGDSYGYQGGNKEKLAAPGIFCLGILQIGESGVVKAKVALPDFTGAMKVMALAVSEDKLGGGESEMKVRRETTLNMTVPRVVAPDDEFIISIEGFNHALNEESAQWTVSAEGAVVSGESKGEFTLPKDKGASVQIPLKAMAEEGTVTLKASMVQGNVTAQAEASVVVRSARPLVEKLHSFSIAPGEIKAISVGKWGRVELGSPALAICGSLQWLADYPYGCLEQTTAAAFPLLAVQELAEAKIIPEVYALGARSKIEMALLNLKTMKLGNGWMSMWPGGTTVWQEGSLFAYLFMFEAECCGYKIDANWRRQIIGNLRSYLNQTGNPVSDRALATWLLAYSEPNVAEVYLKLLPETGKDGFCKFLRAATLVKAGRAADGMVVLEQVLNEHFLTNETELNGFDSLIRRQGLALWILNEIAPDHDAVKKLAESLMGARNEEGHWGTTQNNAWAALGLARYSSRQKQGAFEAKVTVGGEKELVVNQVSRFEKVPLLKVENTGAATVMAYCREREYETELKPFANGIEISRSYVDMDGKPVNEVTRGQLVQVVLHVSFSNGNIGNYVICDMLPGGFEIEDEQLMTRSRMLLPARQESNSSVLALERIEKRFDRFLGFGYQGNDGVFTYKVRAVTAGTFAVPPVTVESMYHPELRALAPHGTPTITVK